MEYFEFKQVIEKLEQESKYLDDLIELDVYVFERLSSSETVVKLLENIFNDKNEWISWWVWEKNFGKKQELQAFDRTGKLIPTTTIKDLYNILTEV